MLLSITLLVNFPKIKIFRLFQKYIWQFLYVCFVKRCSTWSKLMFNLIVASTKVKKWNEFHKFIEFKIICVWKQYISNMTFDIITLMI